MTLPVPRLVLRALIQALNKKGINWWSLWYEPESTAGEQEEEGSSYVETASEEGEESEVEAGGGEKEEGGAESAEGSSHSSGSEEKTLPTPPDQAPGLDTAEQNPSTPEAESKSDSAKEKLPTTESAENPYAQIGDQQTALWIQGNAILSRNFNMCLNTMFGLCIVPAILVALVFLFINWNSKSFDYFEKSPGGRAETDAEYHKTEPHGRWDTANTSLGERKPLQVTHPSTSSARAEEWASLAGGHIPLAAVAAGLYNGSVYLAGRTTKEKALCLALEEPSRQCYTLERGGTALRPTTHFQYLLELEGIIFTWGLGTQRRAVQSRNHDIFFGRSTDIRRKADWCADPCSTRLRAHKWDIPMKCCQKLWTGSRTRGGGEPNEDG